MRSAIPSGGPIQTGTLISYSIRKGGLLGVTARAARVETDPDYPKKPTPAEAYTTDDLAGGDDGRMPPPWSGERTRRELIRLTHRQLDTATLYRDSTQVLSHFVAFDAACGHTMDPATLLLTRQFSEQFDADGFALVCRNEYLQPDVNKFASLLDRPAPVGTLTDATEGRPDRSHRFRENPPTVWIWAGTPSDVHDRRLVLVITRGPASCQPSPEFSPEEQDFVASIGPYIAHAVRSSLLMGVVRDDTFDGDSAPGLVLLNARGEPEAINAPARRWLAEPAVPTSTSGAAGLPGSTTSWPPRRDVQLAVRRGAPQSRHACACRRRPGAGSYCMARCLTTDRGRELR